MRYLAKIWLITILWSCFTSSNTVEQREVPASCTVLPSSGNRQCGVEAYPNYPKSSLSKYSPAPARVASAEECAYLCTRRAQVDRRTADLCLSSEYDPHFGDCQLFTENVSSITSTEKKGRLHIYNDVGCLDCGDLNCNVPVGENLIDNHGFENELLGPWSSIGATLLRGGKESKHRVEFSFPGHKYTYYLHQDYNECVGDWYEVAFDYKCDSMQSAVFPGFLAFAGRYYEFKIGGSRLHKNISGLWQRARFLYKATGAKGSPGLTIQRDESEFGTYDGDFIFSVDNVRASRLGQSPEPANGTLPLVENGGFESGKLSPWKVHQLGYGEVEISSPGLNGSDYAVSIQPYLYNPYRFVLEDVPTIQNKFYILSVDFVLVAPPRYRQNASVAVYTSLTTDDTIGMSTSPEVVVGADGILHTISSPLWAQSNSSRITIDVEYMGAGGKNIYMDNVRLGPVSGDL